VRRLATVEIHKEELKFSAGHFMLFSGTHRETMHGHDYQVGVAFDCTVGNNGMSFDVRDYKERLRTVIQTLDYRFILPNHSPFLKLKEQNEKWLATMGAETFSFYKKDVIVLPITNVTLEDLSNWFLQQLTHNQQELRAHTIHAIRVTIYNGRSESGSTAWDEKSVAKSQPKLVESQALVKPFNR
jgi:6-pyruvoyltetrahydropterin/6-carboxytetrahydropterin synthase